MTDIYSQLDIMFGVINLRLLIIFKLLYNYCKLVFGEIGFFWSWSHWVSKLIFVTFLFLSKLGDLSQAATGVGPRFPAECDHNLPTPLADVAVCRVHTVPTRCVRAALFPAPHRDDTIVFNARRAYIC